MKAKSSEIHASLLNIARTYWDRQGNKPPYGGDSLESYVLLNLMEGKPDEANRAMALMEPEGGQGHRFGLFLQVGLILTYCRYYRELTPAA